MLKHDVWNKCVQASSEYVQAGNQDVSRDSGDLNSIYWEQQGKKALQFEILQVFEAHYKRCW